MQRSTRRRVVVGFEALVGFPYAVPIGDRLPTIARVTATENEYAVLASLTGSLRAVAWGMGVTEGRAKGTIAQLARKIPGTLPAFVRVIAWTRGASREVLGHPNAARHIPEYLLRPECRGQTSDAALTLT